MWLVVVPLVYTMTGFCNLQSIICTSESSLNSTSHNAFLLVLTKMDFLDYNHVHCHVHSNATQTWVRSSAHKYKHPHCTFASRSVDVPSVLFMFVVDLIVLSCPWIFALTLETLFAQNSMTHCLFSDFDICLVIWICLQLPVVNKSTLWISHHL